MTGKFQTAIVFTVTIAVTVTCASVAAQKRVGVTVVESFAPEQSTLAEFFKAADAVLLVEVRNSTPRRYGIGGRGSSDGRLSHEVHVLEVFKDHAHAAPTQIAVTQHAGRIDMGDYIQEYRTQPDAVLKPGRQYVLFLRWISVIGAFEPLDGVWGIYAIDENRRVAPPARQGFAVKQQGKGKEQFLQELRSLAAAGGNE